MISTGVPRCMPWFASFVMSSLRSLTQPYVTAFPIDPGFEVPWIAVFASPPPNCV